MEVLGFGRSCFQSGGGGYCERSYGQGKEDVVSMVLGFVRLGLLELLGAPSLSWVYTATIHQHSRPRDNLAALPLQTKKDPNPTALVPKTALKALKSESHKSCGFVQESLELWLSGAELRGGLLKLGASWESSFPGA